MAGKEVAPDREMTVQDLMRHTSGMTYGLFGDSRVDEMYNDAGVLSENQSVAHFVEKLSKLPLKHQPGTQWDYSVSVDVQGRLIEVLSGKDLATYMRERVFEPLGMRDTACQDDRGKQRALRAGLQEDRGTRMGSSRQTTVGPSGTTTRHSGTPAVGGLVSTTRDYLQFCQMLLNGGILDGTRILSRKTVELMTIDHIGGMSRASSILAAGYGFGPLNFAVHVDPAKSGLNGSVGEYNWGGLAGTSFWIDPRGGTSRDLHDPDDAAALCKRSRPVQATGVPVDRGLSPAFTRPATEFRPISRDPCFRSPSRELCPERIASGLNVVMGVSRRKVLS